MSKNSVGLYVSCQNKHSHKC